MKRFFGLIFNRWVFGLLGVVALCLLIWYGGPLISLGDSHFAPLESEVVRFVIIGIVILWFVLRAVWKIAQAQRSNTQLTEGLLKASPPPPQSEAGSEQVAKLRERFEDAVGYLKKSRSTKTGLFALARKQYLYDLPWYIFIGPPGSGKTTALVNSGLQFPLADKFGAKAIRGVGGTRNCDWWFTDEAVLLDTAGRYTTQESNQESDSAEWTGFLKLLAKYRSRRPINGVLVTISIADLLKQGPAQLADQAAAIRNRLQELHQQLNIRFPIYILVTKLDLIPGFMEFFGEYGREDRAQVWGFTFPMVEKNQNPLGSFDAEFDQLVARLNDRLVARLQQESDVQRRALLYGFPQQFNRIKQALSDLIESAFAPTRYETVPMVRGVYFTSATQEGDPIDRMMGEFARALDLGPRMIPANRPSGKSYFLTRLFKDVIFGEAGIAGSNLRWERQRSAVEWATFAVAAIVTVAALSAWGISYWRNEKYLAEVNEKLRGVAAQVRALPVKASPNLVDLLPVLEAVRKLPDTPMQANGNVPLSMRFGLYQGDKLEAASRTAYERLLVQAFLPALQARIEEDIRAELQRDPEVLYDALKAYVMLSDHEHFDQKALKDYITGRWQDTLPRDVTVEQRKALGGHLDTLLAEGGGRLSYPVDAQLKARARAQLSKTPISQRIYTGLKRADLGRDIPDFTIANAAGPNALQVFTRPSGEPLTSGVPGLFTFDGYHKAFLATSVAVSGILAEEEIWVLGLTSSPNRLATAQLQLNVANEVRRLYLEEYIRIWDTMINDIKLISPNDLAQSVQTARILSAGDSPLPLLLRGIVKEVTLVPPDDPTKSIVDKAKSSIDSGRETIKKMLGNKAPAIPEIKLTRPEAVVDNHFAALRKMVTSPVQGQPAPIDNVTGLVKELYVLLTAAEAATKAGNTPPPSEVPTKVRAEAGQLPEPLRSMLVTLVSSSATQAFGATRGNLSQALAVGVGDFCTRAVTGRFPFDKNSTKDVTPDDFARLFAPGGLFDEFFQKSLAPYVDTSSVPWTFKRVGDTQFSDANATLAQFNRAQAIRNVFFRGGGKGPGLRLEFRPLELDASITQFTLDVDGQVIKYSHGPQVPVAVQWPGPRGSTQVRMEVSPPSAVGASGQVFEGPWALFRMLDKVDMQPTSQQERFIVTFNVNGRKAQFEVVTTSVENPFRLAAIQQFQCPDRL